METTGARRAVRSGAVDEDMVAYSCGAEAGGGEEEGEEEKWWAMARRKEEGREAVGEEGCGRGGEGTGRAGKGKVVAAGAGGEKEPRRRSGDGATKAMARGWGRTGGEGEGGDGMWMMNDE